MKKLRIILPICVILVLLLGGYLMLERVFPQAAPLSVPTAAEVMSVTVTAHDTQQSVALTDPAAQQELLALLTAARPTRKMSVNDTPDVGDYFMVAVETSAAQYRLFVYTEGGQTYVERPYEGIYRADDELFGLVARAFPFVEQNG